MGSGSMSQKKGAKGAVQRSAPHPIPSDTYFDHLGMGFMDYHPLSEKQSWLQRKAVKEGRA